jgi:NADH dehydrogenase FAD-containing subunit
MGTINTDVIIIGAGPTGLSLACQLVHFLSDCFTSPIAQGC